MKEKGANLVFPYWFVVRNIGVNIKQGMRKRIAFIFIKISEKWLHFLSVASILYYNS